MAITASAAHAQSGDPPVISEPFWTSAEWIVSPSGDASPDPGEAELHANWGEALLMQDFAPVSAALPKEAVRLVSPWGSRKDIGAATFEIPAGQPLHAMSIFLGKKSNWVPGSQLFCAPAVNTFPGKIAGIGARWCLIDSDGDGAFDQGAVASARTIYSDFTDFVVSQQTPLFHPVPYEQLDPRPMAAVAGFAVDKAGKGLKVKWAFRYNGKLEFSSFGGKRTLDAVSAAKPGGKIAEGEFAATALPARLTYLGATIEVTGMDASGIRYRVISGFDRDAVLHLSFTADLPVPIEKADD